MQNTAEPSDEYLAELLAKDAREVSQRISGRKPRPANHEGRVNTRFLRTIIRDVEQHNAHLASGSRSGNASDSAGRSADNKRLSPYDDERLRPPKRRKDSSVRSSSVDRSRPRRDRSSRAHRSSPSPSRRHRRRSRDRDEGEHRRSREHRRHHHGESHRHRHRSRSGSPRRKARDRDRSPAREPSISPSNPPAPEGEDSDPLEEFVGPMLPTDKPAARKRGRGATSRHTGMDEHFSSNYDPTKDVQQGDAEEEDEWGLALEALRDRQQWQQQRADRLRAAGFSDTEIQKGNSAKAPDAEAVRWNKKGEGREWDRGKVLDADGNLAGPS